MEDGLLHVQKQLNNNYKIADCCYSCKNCLTIRNSYYCVKDDPSLLEKYNKGELISRLFDSLSERAKRFVLPWGICNLFGGRGENQNGT